MICVDFKMLQCWVKERLYTRRNVCGFLEREWLKSFNETAACLAVSVWACLLLWNYFHYCLEKWPVVGPLVCMPLRIFFRQSVEYLHLCVCVWSQTVCMFFCCDIFMFVYAFVCVCVSVSDLAYRGVSVYTFMWVRSRVYIFFWCSTL